MCEAHLDTRRTSAERTALLMAELTIEEKCAQMVGIFPWVLVTPDGLPAVDSHHLVTAPPGHVAGLTVDDQDRLVLLVGAVQRRMMEETRARIPALIHAEALNGFVGGGHCVFPTASGLASTWSPELVREMAEVISAQMQHGGVRQALAPVLDVAVDARWGRVHETYGEDPYLAAAMGVAYVSGLQSGDLAHGVVATAKHFLGYGLPEGGINLSSTDIGPRRLRDVYAYPFEAAIHLAGMRSVMNSYSDIDSIPVGANKSILTDLLRDAIGFDGFVTSDYTTTQHLVDRQFVAGDAAEAARLAVSAGLDVELPTEYSYGAVLAGEVRRGAIDVALVDASVERILRTKFDLGLFEDPYPRQTIDLAPVADRGEQLSRELADRSVVLLENRGLLPLTGPTKVVLMGPHADSATMQFPTYTYPAWREMVTRMSRGELGNAIGVDMAAADWNDALFPPITTEELVRTRYGATTLRDEIASRCDLLAVETTTTLTGPFEADSFDRVRPAIDEADVIVLALGGASLWFNGQRTEGEASDSADISLPAGQVALAEAAAASGKPVVAVLFQGKGYALPAAVTEADAVVVASFGGPHGPASVAAALVGEVSPSGRLPYSIPRHSGQMPLYHHQRLGSGQRNPFPPAVPQHYLDMPATAAYPFGSGRGFSSISVDDLSHDPTVDTTGALTVSARVSNTGERDDVAVLQLYVAMQSAGITRPSQQLAGFARVPLAAGAFATVEFQVAASQLGCTDVEGELTIAPGRGRLFVGQHSEDRANAGEFEVVGQAVSLTSAARSYLATTIVG